MSLATVASSAEIGGTPPDAYATAVERLHRIRAWPQLWTAIESLAAYWADSGETESAAVLLGHLDAHDHRSNLLTRRRAKTQQTLANQTGIDKWLRAGSNLDRDHLVAYALQQLTIEHPEPGKAPIADR
jgi:hypothetical protein